MKHFPHLEDQVEQNRPKRQEAVTPEDLIARAGPASGSKSSPLEQSEQQKFQSAVTDRPYGLKIEAASKVTSSPEAKASVSVHQLSDSTRQALDKQGLLDKQLKDKVGGKTVSEAIAKTALENEPGILKNDDGSDLVIKGIAYGQFDRVRGIDLVPIDVQGRPAVVEVKGAQKRQADLDDEPLSSIETKDGSEVKQLDDNWVRDRWRRLISGGTRRSELYAAGIRPEYLNPRNFARNDARLWKDVLGKKAVLVVSSQGDRAVGSKLTTQCAQRGVDQIGIVNL